MGKNRRWFAGEPDTLWVSQTGAYGTTEVLLVDTSHWTKRDFQELDDAADEDRQFVAEQITKQRNKDYKWAVKQMIASKAIEIKVFRMDEDGVAEVDEDGEIK